MEVEDGAKGDPEPGKAAIGKAQDRLRVLYVDLYVAKSIWLSCGPESTFGSVDCSRQHGQ